MSRSCYEPESLGSAYFPESLENRLRPWGFESITIGAGLATRRFLSEQGIDNLDLLFHLSISDLEQFPLSYRKFIYKYLDSKMPEIEERLSFTPQERLLREAIGENIIGPVKAEDEPLLAEQINAALSKLQKRDENIVRLWLGLDSWEPMPLTEIAKLYSLSATRIKWLLDRGLSVFKNEARRQDLIQTYEAFPLHSLGRSLGYVYKRDFPNLPIVPEDMMLSTESADELTYKSSRFKLWRERRERYLHDDAVAFYKVFPFSDILDERLTEPLSDTAVAELSAAFYRSSKKYAQYSIFGNLLEEITRAQNSTEVIKNMTMEELFGEVPTAVKLRLEDIGKLTLGELIEHGQHRGNVVDDVAVKALRKLSAKLKRYLDILRED